MRHPSATSSSSTSVSRACAFAVTRIDTNDGSSLVRPMRNSSTSNAASWRTTVSNIAFISWESIRWPSASTTSVTGTSEATASSPRRVPERRALLASMCHPVDHDVDADGVAVRRELVEVFLALAFALPRVRDVGVVGHHHHQPPFLVGDAAEVHVRAVRSPLRRAAGLDPETDVRDLLHFLDVVEDVHHRVVRGDVQDRILVRRQHPADLVLPLVPRARSPEVVDDDISALLQIGAKALHLLVAEADDAHVFHVDDRTTIQKRIGEANDDVVGLSGLVELHVHGGELAQTHGEIVVRTREVGAPAGAALLEAIAGEVGAAEIERSVEVFDLGPLRRLAVEAADSAAADPDARLPLRILLAHLIDRRGGGDREEHRDGERVQQAGVAHEGPLGGNSTPTIGRVATAERPQLCPLFRGLDAGNQPPICTPKVPTTPLSWSWL